MKKKYKVLALFGILIIGTIFIVLNFTNILKEKKKVVTTSKTTTTLPLGSDEIFDSTIYIEGEEESVKFKTYNSYLGYSFNYMIDYFSVTNSSNNVILISSIYDNTNYIKIEKLNEIEYSNLYETTENEVKDGYLYEYSFVKGNNVYLKITKCLINSSEYLEGIGTRMDYVINSIEI